MLFDLRGRRRRAVQVTYLFLALLMGGGLVLFGVGGSVSGGLLDAFKGGGGGSSGDSALQDKVQKEEERLAKSPQNEVVLQNLVRDYYSLATSQRESGSVGFPDDAKDELRKADQYWQRYLTAAEGDPSPDAANVALQLYAPTALNKPKELVKAGSILAKDSNDTASYLRLVSYAALAGDTRTADLAAAKAADLAPKSQRKLVKQQAEAIKKQAKQQQPSG
jgi:hypothetical protein